MNKVEFINDAYTEDGLRLPMVHFNTTEKDICVIFIHGMCQTIIDNYFSTVWGNILSNNNIGFLYEHNRGYSIENDILMKDNSYKRCGCMYEIFEDSIYDIDLAINKAKELGYKRFILLGHSYGCNKVIYYYYKKHPNILGIILASAPDMIGSHLSNQSGDYKELLEEAKENINNNEPTKLLHKMIEDYMYMSSQTYYNWYNENSELNNLPIISNPKKWKQFEAIDVPILTFSGSKEEDYYLHLDLLKEKAKSCKNFEYKYIDNTNHFYNNKEIAIGNLILSWIKKF
ncbi:MAG: alpha/beta hydrolase [Bacilli bacterium]|nr:alpha/beta hydrolase [Bacilli bacterium]